MNLNLNWNWYLDNDAYEVYPSDAYSITESCYLLWAQRPKAYAYSDIQHFKIDWIWEKTKSKEIGGEGKFRNRLEYE